MEHISCYIDAQGFYHKQKFHPREIAILSKFGVLSFSIDHGIKYDSLSWCEKRSVSHCTKNHHGLPFNSKDGLSLFLLPKLLTSVFEATTDPDHFLAGVKSKEAEQMLRDIGIPRLNLGKYGAHWKQFDGNYEPCSLHINPGKCSLNAVMGMKKWVEKYQSQPKKVNQEEKKSSLKDIWDKSRERWVREGHHQKWIDQDGNTIECD